MSHPRAMLPSGLVAWLLAQFVALSSAPSLAQGQGKVPALKLGTLTGQQADLQAVCKQSKAVVFTFWKKFSPLTAPHLSGMQKLKVKYSGKVQILSFAQDVNTKAALDAVLKRVKPTPTFPVFGAKASTQLAAKLGVTVYPTVLTVGPNCAVTFKQTGFGAQTNAQIEAALKKLLGQK